MLAQRYREPYEHEVALVLYVHQFNVILNLNFVGFIYWFFISLPEVWVSWEPHTFSRVRNSENNL